MFNFGFVLQVTGFFSFLNLTVIFRGISAETYFLRPKLGGYSGFRGANWEMYFDIYYLGCFIYILLPIMEKYESRILLLIFEVGF